MFQQDGVRAHTSKATIAGWTQILNTTFRRRTGRLIHRICLRLRTFGALWQQPFMPTPSLSHCKHSSTVSEKHGNQFLCVSTLQNLIGSMPNRLCSHKKQRRYHSILTVIIEHGQRHRLTLTFIGPLMCNFNSGVI